MNVDNSWAQELEDELSEQYDVPANVSGGKYVKYVEVELPATRHSLEVRTIVFMVS